MLVWLKKESLYLVGLEPVMHEITLVQILAPGQVCGE